LQLRKNRKVWGKLAEIVGRRWTKKLLMIVVGFYGLITTIGSSE
jgi:hypothetical protein